jgi:hypothetical protein
MAEPGSLRLLSREEIQQQEQLRHEDVPTPEWGANSAVRVRELTADERDVFESATIRIRRDIIQSRSGRQRQAEPEMDFVEEALHNMRARLVAAAAIDGTGNKLFTEEDVVWLGKRSAAALDRVYAVAASLSGLSDTDVEALMKGLRAIPNGASSSGSR